ncbi:MAG: hypothetical protein ACYTKD_02955 [Planctomycetota bacterium]
MPGIKRSLDIRLNKKVDEGALRAIALVLRAQDSRRYKRAFITYYLPGMPVGAGAWATTHFNPGLKVEILGLTAETEQELISETPPANWEIIGRWLDESPYGGGRISIFRENGQLFMEQKFRDGSTLRNELAEKKTSLGRRFDAAEDASAGDHWLLVADGGLQIRDNDGLIATARRMR